MARKGSQHGAAHRRSTVWTGALSTTNRFPRRTGPACPNHQSESVAWTEANFNNNCHAETISNFQFKIHRINSEWNPGIWGSTRAHYGERECRRKRGRRSKTIERVGRHILFSDDAAMNCIRSRRLRAHYTMLMKVAADYTSTYINR